MMKKIDNTLLSLFKKYNDNKNSLTEDELLIIEQNKSLFKEHLSEYQNIQDKLDVCLINSDKDGLLKVLDEVKDIEHLKLSVEKIDLIKSAISDEETLNIESKLNVVENSRRENIQKGIKNIIGWMNQYVDYFGNVNNEFNEEIKTSTIDNIVETNKIDTSSVEKLNTTRDEIRKINTLLSGENYSVEDLIEIIWDEELKGNLQSKMNELKSNSEFLEQLKVSIYESDKLSSEDKKSLEFFDSNDIYDNLNQILKEKGISEKISSNMDLSTVSNKYKSIFQRDDISNELQRIKNERNKQSNLKSLELYSKYNSDLPQETKELYNELVISKFKSTLDKDYLTEKKNILVKEMEKSLIENGKVSKVHKNITKKTEQQEYIDKILSSYKDLGDVEMLKLAINEGNLNNEVVDKLLSVIESWENIVENIESYTNQDLNVRVSLFNKMKDKSSFSQFVKNEELTSLEKDYLQSLLAKNGFGEGIDKIDDLSYSFDKFMSSEFETSWQNSMVFKNKIIESLSKYDNWEVSLDSLYEIKEIKPIIEQLIKDGKVNSKGNIVENSNAIKLALWKWLVSDFNEMDYIWSIDEKKSLLSEIGKILPEIRNEIEGITQQKSNVSSIINGISSYNSLSNEDKVIFKKELELFPELNSVFSNIIDSNNGNLPMDSEIQVLNVGNSLLKTLNEKSNELVLTETWYEAQLKEFGFNSWLLSTDLLSPTEINSKYLQKKIEIEGKYKLEDFNKKIYDLTSEKKNIDKIIKDWENGILENTLKLKDLEKQLKDKNLEESVRYWIEEEVKSLKDKIKSDTSTLNNFKEDKKGRVIFFEEELKSLKMKKKDLNEKLKNVKSDVERDKIKWELSKIDGKIKSVKEKIESSDRNSEYDKILNGIELSKNEYSDIKSKITNELDGSDIWKQNSIIQNGLGWLLSGIVSGRVISDGYVEKIKEKTDSNAFSIEDDLNSVGVDNINELYSKEEIEVDIWNFKKTLFERGVDWITWLKNNVIDTKNKTIQWITDSVNKVKENEFITWINDWLSTTKSILDGDFLPNEKMWEYLDKMGGLSKNLTLGKWVWYVLTLSNVYFNIYELIVWMFDKTYKWMSSNSWFVVQMIFVITAIFLFLLTLATGGDSFLFTSVYNSNVFLPVDLNVNTLVENSNSITKTGIYLTTNFFTGFFTIMMGSLMLFTLMMIVLRWLTITWMDTITISSGDVKEWKSSSDIEWVNLKNEKVKLVWNIITFIILVILNFFLMK